eukprot:3073625-Pyramimonas_sp.AAC.1
MQSWQVEISGSTVVGIIATAKPPTKVLTVPTESVLLDSFSSRLFTSSCKFNVLVPFDEPACRHPPKRSQFVKA